MVANRVLLKLKCGRNVSRRGARRYPSILKILVRSFFYYGAFSLLTARRVVYCDSGDIFDKDGLMGAAVKRKTSLTLNVSALDAAHEVGINASAVAEDALIRAVTQEQRRQWLNLNSAVGV